MEYGVTTSLDDDLSTFYAYRQTLETVPTLETQTIKLLILRTDVVGFGN